MCYRERPDQPFLFSLISGWGLVALGLLGSVLSAALRAVAWWPVSASAAFVPEACRLVGSSFWAPPPCEPCVLSWCAACDGFVQALLSTSLLPSAALLSAAAPVVVFFLVSSLAGCFFQALD